MTRIIEHGQNPAPGDGLLARFGPDAALPDVLTALAHARAEAISHSRAAPGTRTWRRASRKNPALVVFNSLARLIIAPQARARRFSPALLDRRVAFLWGRYELAFASRRITSL
jgi:hypothetical protein